MIERYYRGTRLAAILAFLVMLPYRLVRAYWYSMTGRSRHRFRRAQRLVPHMRQARLFVHRDKVPERYIGKRRRPRGWTLPTVDSAPLLPSDPHVAFLAAIRRNTDLIMTGQEGPHAYVNTTASVLGRNPYQTGPYPRAAESLLQGQGSGDHHGHYQPNRRRRVQWATEGLSARIKALHDLVQEGMPEDRRSDAGTGSGLRRLSLHSRRSERAATGRPARTGWRFDLRYVAHLLRMRETYSQLWVV